MKMWIVAEVNDTEFDTENVGFVCMSSDEAKDTKTKLEEANPGTEYKIWEIN